MFKMLALPGRIAAAPIIKMPVPKKNDEAIDAAKYFLKIMFKKTYKLAQPRLIITFPKSAQTSEPKLTENGNPTSKPASIVPIRYVPHMQAIENAQVSDFEIM